MKRVIISNIQGGLGNLLFQISAGYSKSIDEDCNYIVDYNSYYGGHKPVSNYFDNILRNPNFSNINIESEVYNETSHTFNEIPKINNNQRLNGYFQSEKYFKHNREKIINLFEPTELDLKKINLLYSDLLIEETCSIHVRRGDYVNLQNHHPLQTIEYFKNSVDYIGNDKVYLIFSDDINYCESNFDFIENKIFVKDLLDYEEIYLMSMCKNNIISNSSFSWWGAWLNQNNNTVISPKNWFGPALSILNPKDIYCQDWVIL
jgi:hypothetical protein